jgi:hypothetical protein
VSGKWKKDHILAFFFTCFPLAPYTPRSEQSDRRDVPMRNVNEDKDARNQFSFPCSAWERVFGRSASLGNQTQSPQSGGRDVPTPSGGKRTRRNNSRDRQPAQCPRAATGSVSAVRASTIGESGRLKLRLRFCPDKHNQVWSKLRFISSVSYREVSIFNASSLDLTGSCSA